MRGVSGRPRFLQSVLKEKFSRQKRKKSCLLVVCLKVSKSIGKRSVFWGVKMGRKLDIF